MFKGLAITTVCFLLLGSSVTRAQTSPTTRAAVEPADNSYCFACHANFKREFLAASHAKAGVGCATCHGESDKHSSDENNTTPPDTMFAKAKITGACMSKCHSEADLHKAEKKMTEPLHTTFLAGKLADKKWCTDCHGTHTLPVRTRRWDKITGKLIQDDGVRMVQTPGK